MHVYRIMSLLFIKSISLKITDFYSIRKKNIQVMLNNYKYIASNSILLLPRGSFVIVTKKVCEKIC